MNKFMYYMIILLCSVLSVRAMDPKKLLVQPSESLMKSVGKYDVGLGEKHQVNWDSNETRAFIKALQDQTIKIDSTSKCLKFSSYSYSIGRARSKFQIMAINAKAGKTVNYVLQCLFLNKDVETEFETCETKYKHKMNQLVRTIYERDDDELAHCLWMMIGEKLRMNRTKLKKAFEQGEISALAAALKKPLCVEHITFDYIMRFWHK